MRALAVIKGLTSMGHSVIATVRDMEKSGKHVESLGAKCVEVKDLSDEAALVAVFTGAAGIFHLAAVHPEYGFEKTPEGRAGILATAVEGTVSVLRAAKAAGVERVVLTSSLAAIECGNDEGVLTEAMWSKAEVYDAKEKLEDTQWGTHYTYVKSKVEQERAAVAFAKEVGLDLRVVVPGNLCVGPIASEGINGTMTRLRDIAMGTNTLKGAADLAIVHVLDVVAALVKCMTVDSASGRYIVSQDMVQIETVFETLKKLFPALPIAALENMDVASGVRGKARKIESRVETDLGIKLRSFDIALKDSVDALIERQMVVPPAAVSAC